METFRASDGTGSCAWEALDPAEVEGGTVRLHWTDAPDVGHVNDGPEVFAVLDGRGDTHVRSGGNERINEMCVGDVCATSPGDGHVAMSVGAARILVVDRRGASEP